MNAVRLLLPALTVGLSFLSPALSRAASEPAEQSESTKPSRVALSVDNSGLLKEQPAYIADPIKVWVTEDVQAALRERHGIEVIEDPSAPLVLVNLGWVDYANSIYRIEIVARRPDEEPVTVTTIEQTFAKDTDVAKAAAENLAAAVAHLSTTAKPSNDGSAEAGAQGTDSTQEGDGSDTHTEPDPGEHRGRPAPLSLKGKVGIGLLAAGVAGLGTGIGLVVVNERLDAPDSAPYLATGRQYRAPGIALAVSGGALAATGAVLLVLDRVSARKRGPGSALRVTPTLNGIQFAGRF